MPLGFHVSKSTVTNGKKKNRSISAALREDVEWLREFGVARPCAQIFVSGPQSFKETLSEEDKIATAQWSREAGVPVVIHGSYLDHPWNRSPGSVHNIKQEMRIAARIGAVGVIVHLGAGAASDENLKYVLEEISDLPVDVTGATTLWLEIHTAKPSGFTYETPEKLRALFARVAAHTDNGKGLKVGLCIDTAHLFSCGTALDTYARATEWLAGLPQGVPVMCHLNDSASSLASGVDKHETLCEGNLWGKYHPIGGVLPIEESGLVAILNWAESNDIMVILERDTEGTTKDLNLIRSLGYFID